MDDLIRTTFQGFLGLSVNCARCHDHKFDPITRLDYYRSMAMFNGYVNYDYLLGFRFADDALRLRIDTDAAGLVTIAPGATPLAIARSSSTSGRGGAVDVGVGATLGPLALGFGVNRIGNHIVWTDVTRTTYSLQTLVSGVFIESGEIPVADARVELPLDVRADAAYDGGPWTIAEAKVW